MRRRGGGGGGSGCGRMVLEKKLHQQPSEGGREGLVHTPSSLLAVVLVLATGTEMEVLPSLFLSSFFARCQLPRQLY